MRDGDKIDLSDISESDSSEQVSEEVTSPRFQSDTPLSARWVIKYSGGLVEDESQANYVLIGFIILVTILSIFLVFRIFKESPSVKEYDPDIRYEARGGVK